MIRAGLAGLLRLLSIGALLAGCQGAASPAPTMTREALPDVLDGSYWELRSMQGQPPLPGTTITLNFADGKIGGSTHCNRYGAPYRLKGNRLQLVEMFTLTAQGCNTPEGVMEQERAYVDILQKTIFTAEGTFRLVEDSAGQQLEIGDALGVPVLVYQSRLQFAMNPLDLPGTAWRLVSLEGAPLHSAGITFAFLNEREFGGFAGCRQVYGSYQAHEDRITFPYIAMIGPDCHANERLNLQESTFTDALSRTTSYHQFGGRLDLAAEQGGVTSFLADEDTIELEDAIWKLAALLTPSTAPEVMPRMPVEPLPGSEITLEFDGQRASGMAGCNEYAAPYTTGAQRLAVDALVKTDMHCAQPEGLMRQEEDFLRLLAAVNTYQVLGGQLWLESERGQGLLFIRKQSE